MESGLVAQDDSRIAAASPGTTVRRMGWGRIIGPRPPGVERSFPGETRWPEENRIGTDRTIVTSMDDDGASAGIRSSRGATSVHARCRDDSPRVGIGNGNCVPEGHDPSWAEVAGPVRRFLRRIVGAERAEDLASDTMLTLLEYAGKRRVRRPVSFALRVAWNKAVDLLRRDGGRERPAGSDALEAVPADDRARIAELREWLDAGLARLSAEDRALLHLRYDEGLEYRDLARTFAVPVGTVGRRLHEARRRLAAALRASDEGRGLSIVTAFLPALASRAATLADALGVTAARAAAQVPARAWWVLAMSKKLAFAAVLVLLGAGGLAWWLMRPGGGDGVSAPAAGGGLPGPASVVEAPRPAAAPPSKIEARPFQEDPSVVLAVLSGRVVDPDGAPVGGARVHVAGRGGAGGFDADAATDQSGPRRVVTTEADGTFLAPVDGLGCTFDVIASAAGFAPTILEEVALSGPPLEIRLGRGMAVTGTVRDFDERPIGGARITFRGLAGRGRFRIASVTDAAGKFSLTALPDPATLTLGTAMRGNGFSMGESHLLVEAEGLASQRVGALDSPFGDGKAPPPFDIRLARGGVVEGVVRDVATGAPVADAEVVVWTIEGMQGTRVDRGLVYRNPFGSRIVLRAKTDAAGRYRIERVPAAVGGIRLMSSAMNKLANGRMRLGGVVAHREGFAPSGGELGSPNEDGEVQTIALALKASAVITGRVVDETGTPIEGARVFCLDDAPGPTGFRQGGGGLVPGEAGTLGGSVLSDSDGRFRHPSVPAPKSGTGTANVYACGCDFGLGNSGGAKVEVRAGANASVPDLVLKRGMLRIVEGDVRDQAGLPIAGAIICASRDPSASMTGVRQAAPVYSDRRGRFRYEVPVPTDPAAPPPAVFVTARGRIAETVGLPAPGERLIVVLLGGARIAGVAARPDGAPAGGAEIRAVDASLARADNLTLMRAPTIASARCDVTGAFRLEGLPANPVLLVGSSPGEGPLVGTAGPLVAPARDVSVTLPAPPKPQGAVVRVRVLDGATGKPWTAALEGTMTMESANGGPPAIASGTVESPGRLHFRVAAGVWDLRIDSPGLAPWTRKGLVVEEPGGDPIEVRLGGGSVLEGKVVAPGVGSLEGVLITGVQAGGKSFKARATTDGTFAIRGIDPGRWDLTAADIRLTRQLATASPITVELSATPVSVEVPLVEAVKTKVSVTCKRGAPGVSPASRPAIDEIHLVLEDSAGRTLVEGHPWLDEDSVASCELWTAPQPLKAVVRVGDRVLGTAEGAAGGEIRMTVLVE